MTQSNGAKITQTPQRAAWCCVDLKFTSPRADCLQFWGSSYSMRRYLCSLSQSPQPPTVWWARGRWQQKRGAARLDAAGERPTSNCLSAASDTVAASHAASAAAWWICVLNRPASPTSRSSSWRIVRPSRDNDVVAATVVVQGAPGRWRRGALATRWTVGTCIADDQRLSDDAQLRHLCRAQPTATVFRRLPTHSRSGPFHPLVFYFLTLPPTSNTVLKDWHRTRGYLEDKPWRPWPWPRKCCSQTHPCNVHRTAVGSGTVKISEITPSKTKISTQFTHVCRMNSTWCLLLI